MTANCKRIVDTDLTFKTMGFVKFLNFSDFLYNLTVLILKILVGV